MLKEPGIVIFAWFQCFVCFGAPHVLGILIPVLALCSVCFGVIALVFALRQKRMFWGHTLKERDIVLHGFSVLFDWSPGGGGGGDSHMKVTGCSSSRLGV